LTSDLLELPFLGELLIQSLQLLNQVSTSSDDGVLGSEWSIGLDTQFKGCEQRVRDFVGGEQDVGWLCEFGTEEVGEGVVFLVEGEDCCVGDTCGIKALEREGGREGKTKLTGFGCPGYFLFAVAEEEELESWGNIVSDVVVVCFVDCEGGDGGAHEVVVIRCHLEFGCGSAVKWSVIECLVCNRIIKSLDHGTGMRQRKVFKRAIL
jgi:hypothetical protein